MSRARRIDWLLAALAVTVAATAEAQGAPKKQPDAERKKCTFQVDNVDREVMRTEPAPGTINYFAGGNVRLSCVGTQVRISSDSLAAYAGTVVQFIGNVKYQDSSMVMTTDFGTYYKDDERWESQGNVVATNKKTGTVLKGPFLNYWRAVEGMRDTSEVEATGRPTVTYFPDDTVAGREKAEPYTIVGDVLRFRGSNRIWGWGHVTVNRSDLATRSDSLDLDTGPRGLGILSGGYPEMRGLGPDSFTINGRRIDLELDHRELNYVTAKGDGKVVRETLELVGDTIRMRVSDKKLEQTVAWGRNLRPKAVSPDYEIIADSLAFDTPEQKLTEARLFGNAWISGRPDTTTVLAEPDSLADSTAAPDSTAAHPDTAAGGTGLILDRDWIAGDTVVANFAQRDSAGTARTALTRLFAQGQARSFYRVKSENPRGRPSLSYSRGRRITITMKTGDRTGVERVDIGGKVDGVQLEPQLRVIRVRADSAPPPPIP